MSKYTEWADKGAFRERFLTEIAPPYEIGYFVEEDAWDMTTNPPSRTITKLRLTEVALTRPTL